MTKPLPGTGESPPADWKAIRDGIEAAVSRGWPEGPSTARYVDEADPSAGVMITDDATGHMVVIPTSAWESLLLKRIGDLPGEHMIEWIDENEPVLPSEKP